jgi:glycosyltransferase involved in cell wall biosynthesis
MTIEFAAFDSAQIRDFTRKRESPASALPTPRTRLSVVVPSFNQVAFVERTMNSIANQHYANLQLIVLDGGSVDGSQAVIERYRDLVAYYESGKDDGQAAAINKGFGLATGDFIAWQNSDDLYLPGFFCAVDEAVQRYPKADLIIANSYVVNKDDDIIWATKYGPFSREFLARVGWNLTSQSVFVRRDLAQKAGSIPNYRICFDFEWFLKVTEAAGEILHLKRYGGAYRIHAASKLETESKGEREKLENEILRSFGYRVRSGRSYAQQWPVRRRLLVARQHLHCALLYPHRGLPGGAMVSRCWAAILNQAGSRLVGF